jgi:hypothetical protein
VLVEEAQQPGDGDLDPELAAGLVGRRPPVEGTVPDGHGVDVQAQGHPDLVPLVESDRAGALPETLERSDPTSFAVEEPPDEADGVTTAWFTFETAVGRGRGLLRLVDENGQPKAWTFLTTLYELKGHEEPIGPVRPMGAERGANKET